MMTRCLKQQDESLLVNILINIPYNFISFIKLKEIVGEEFSYLICSLNAQPCSSPH
jgi:hypothetical protein